MPRTAAPPRTVKSARLLSRGARPRRALPQVGAREDLAPGGIAQARPRPAAPLPRAVRGWGRALLRGFAAAGQLERRQRRADPLLPPGARRRLLRTRRARPPRLREVPLQQRARARPAAPLSGGARRALHLPEQDLLQRPLAGEPRRPLQRAHRPLQESALQRSGGADHRQPRAQGRADREAEAEASFFGSVGAALVGGVPGIGAHGVPLIGGVWAGRPWEEPWAAPSQACTALALSQAQKRRC